MSLKFENQRLEPNVALVPHLVRLLSRIDPGTLTKTAVILPTARLSTLLLVELARIKGALRPPSCFTLEGFLNHYSSLGTESAAWELELSGTELEVLFKRCIDTMKHPAVRVGSESELAALFEELAAEGVSHIDFFSRLETGISEDVYRHESQLLELLKRKNGVAAVIAHIQHWLTERRALSAMQAHAAKAQRVAQLIATGKYASITEHFIFAGFASMARSLVNAFLPLVEQEKISFILHEAPSLSLKANPLLELQQLIEKISPLRPISHSIEDLKPATTHIRIHKATTRTDEVHFAVTEIKKLLKEGAQSAEIAILLTQEGTYGELLEGVFASIPKNQATVRRFSTGPLGTWILGLKRFLLEPETRTLALLLLHPVSCKAFSDKSKLSLDQVKTCIHRLFPSAMSTEVFADDLRAGFFPEAKEFTLILADLLEKKQQRLRQSHNDWQAIFSTLAQSMIDANVLESSNLFQARGLSLVLDNEVLTLVEYLQILERELDDIEERSIGEPLDGIQILALAESRHFPFRYCFVLGCEEGRFPAAPPRDDLIDDHLKRRAGLQGWRNRQAIEELTTLFLIQNVEQLHFCFAEADCTNSPLQPSRFVEDLIWKKNIPLEIVELEIAVTDTVTKPCNTAPQWPQGTIDKKRLSASTLEDFIACPLRYWGRQHALEPLKLPQVDLDPIFEGVWLHKVVEGAMRFIQQRFSDLKSTEQTPALLNTLLELSRTFGPKGIEASALWQHLKTYSWPKMAEFFGKIYQSIPGPIQLDIEKEFSTDLVFHDCQESYDAMGRIDVILRSKELVMVIDFKRVRGLDRSEVKSGTKPQLPFYLRLINQSSHESIAGYFGILTGEWMPIVMSEQARAYYPDLPKARNVDLSTYWQNIERLFYWRRKEVLENGLYPDASACGFCKLNPMCRRDDVLQSDTIESFKRLEKILESDKIKKQPQQTEQPTHKNLNKTALGVDA